MDSNIDDEDYTFISRRDRRKSEIMNEIDELNKYVYINSNGEYEFNYTWNVKEIINIEEPKIDDRHTIKMNIYKSGKIIELPTDENIIMKELDNVNTSGVYVCRMTNSKYYVGKSNNIARRIQEHKSFCGSSISTRGERIISFLAPITPPHEDLFIWEEIETLARMKTHSIQNVRGAGYTSINDFDKMRLRFIEWKIQKLFGDHEIKLDESKYLIKKKQIKDKLIHNDGNVIMDKNVNIKTGLYVICKKVNLILDTIPIYFVKQSSNVSKYINKLYDKNKDIIIYHPITRRIDDEDIKEWCKREVLIRILHHGCGFVCGPSFQKCFADDNLRNKIYDEICNLFD